MSTRVSPWPAGTPCWTDLQTPDVTAAREFYAAVLGWEFDEPAEELGGYTTARVDGRAVAGVQPEQVPGVPSGWLLHLASEDAEATERAVAAAGGSVLLSTGDVGGLGRFCAVADPTGAAFGVWQAGTMTGAEAVNEPGAITWEDLRSLDPARAIEFYRTVFGYRTEALEAAGPDYVTFHLGDDPAPSGGMGGTWGAPGPSHWLVYFGVADVDAAVRSCTEHGGRLLGEPMDTPYGRMAPLADPFGAVFTVTDPSGTEQPDRTG